MKSDPQENGVADSYIQNKRHSHLTSEIAEATTLGWNLAIPIFGGVLLGHFLDNYFQMGYVFTVSLLFVGIVAGFYNIWRFARRFAARQRKTIEEQF